MKQIQQVTVEQNTKGKIKEWNIDCRTEIIVMTDLPCHYRFVHDTCRNTFSVR